MRVTPAGWLVFLLLTSGCAQNKLPEAAAVAETKPIAEPAKAAAPQAPAPTVNPNRAMQYVREIVAIGRRAPGSPGHNKEESYIKNHLNGDTVEQDAFTAKTPAGEFQLNNVVAKYPGAKDCILRDRGNRRLSYVPRAKCVASAAEGRFAADRKNR